jgi:hypothetical protein
VWVGSGGRTVHEFVVAAEIIVKAGMAAISE